VKEAVLTTAGCHASIVAFTKYGPKEPLSPSIGELCPICHRPFQAGDYTTLIRTTRTSLHGDRRIEAHWDCATKQPG
jgi:hypothetical protein